MSEPKSIYICLVKNFKHIIMNKSELIAKIEIDIAMEARLETLTAIRQLIDGKTLTDANESYLKSMLDNGTLTQALAGVTSSNPPVNPGIDELLLQSKKYQTSDEFNEMIRFMGQFRDYAPYNNMLVRVQNPSCSFYATAHDWYYRFERTLKEDAKPMIILAPMHPVMLVYDLDQTEGKALPRELEKFSAFEGKWESKWLERLIENANRHRIKVDFKSLSTTNSGFATFSRSQGNWKMRIAIHDELDEPSRFGVLCHELAHIFLGHLGADKDLWWPSRSNLTRSTAEIEAESVAFIVTSQIELLGTSAAYISRHLGKNDKFPDSVSIDYIAKVAGKIERMTRGLLAEPKEKVEKKKVVQTSIVDDLFS